MKKNIFKVLLLVFIFFFTFNVRAEEICEDYNACKPDEIPNKSYVIGNYLYTKAYGISANDIVYASADSANQVFYGYISSSKAFNNITFNNNTLIYYKDLEGKWRNNLTREVIDAPTSFKITYVDMESVTESDEGINSTLALLREVQARRDELENSIGILQSQVRSLNQQVSELEVINTTLTNEKQDLTDENNELNVKLQDAYFKVTFIYDDKDSHESYSEFIKNGSSITEPEYDEVLGNTYGGWYNGEVKYEFDNSKINGPITLIERYNVKKFDVTIKYNNGNSDEIRSIPYGEKVTIPDEPSKEGFKFIGWFLDDAEYSFDEVITHELTIEARYKEYINIENLIATGISKLKDNGIFNTTYNSDTKTISNNSLNTIDKVVGAPSTGLVAMIRDSLKEENELSDADKENGKVPGPIDKYEIYYQDRIVATLDDPAMISISGQNISIVNKKIIEVYSLMAGTDDYLNITQSDLIGKSLLIKVYPKDNYVEAIGTVNTFIVNYTGDNTKALVSNEDSLNKALGLSNITNISITKDINTLWPIIIPEGRNIVIEGNNHTIKYKTKVDGWDSNDYVDNEGNKHKELRRNYVIKAVNTTLSVNNLILKNSNAGLLVGKNVIANLTNISFIDLNSGGIECDPTSVLNLNNVTINNEEYGRPFAWVDAESDTTINGIQLTKVNYVSRGQYHYYLNNVLSNE